MISQETIDAVREAEEEGRKTFFFLAYTNKRTSVTIIDLSHVCDYEREDWATVNDLNFNCLKKAIAYGRDFAERHGFNYELFESRYDSDLSEKLY